LDLLGRAQYGQFPWQALIFTSVAFYIGSGVLIDQNHILTVAHRFDKQAA
jgi:hypothetical protein